MLGGQGEFNLTTTFTCTFCVFLFLFIGFNRLSRIPPHQLVFTIFFLQNPWKTRSLSSIFKNSGKLTFWVSIRLLLANNQPQHHDDLTRRGWMLAVTFLFYSAERIAIQKCGNVLWIKQSKLWEITTIIFTPLRENFVCSPDAWKDLSSSKFQSAGFP